MTFYFGVAKEIARVIQGYPSSSLSLSELVITCLLYYLYIPSLGLPGRCVMREAFPQV